MPGGTGSERGRSGRRPGLLALVGGGAWGEQDAFDAELLERADTEELLLLPTAAAYERPERQIEAARSFFAGTVGVRALMVMSRSEAEDEANAAAIRQSRFIYLADGSPLHLRSVLKASRAWQAVFDAWESGAVVAGVGAGAMVLTDPMVDPRGGAFTLGLGLVVEMSVIPDYLGETEEKHRRTIRLAPRGVPVAAVPRGSALVREPDGTWRSLGARPTEVFVDGVAAGLDALPR